MAILIGIDEAGYGPKLGPLVVSAALFRCQNDDMDLWRTLDEAVTAARDSSSRLLVTDSKIAYSTGGLPSLERASLSFLKAAGKNPASVQDLLEMVSPDSCLPEAAYPWYQALDHSLPFRADPRTVHQSAEKLCVAMRDRSISFLGFSSKVLRAKEFNNEIERTGNKARLLFAACADLIRAALESTSDPDVVIVLDRHGGRHYYAKLLASAWPFARVQTIIETPRHSQYLMFLLDRTASISFTVQADRSSLPVALASMLSKYLRELHMSAFNDWWTSHVPGLAPTAGYAEHATGFIEAIEPAIRAAGVDRLALVRQR